MGVVYLARDPRLGRLVAVKVLRPGALDSAESRRRLRIEAEAAGTLDHPNIVPVLDVTDSAVEPYLAMKFIPGGSLAERLAEGLLEPKTAATLMLTVARAVEHAHQRGILHRDLKPSNILLDESGEPHLTDFGLAKLLASDLSLTLSQAPLGTCGYMAPEVAREGARSATIASDVYSLGAILYELLAGRPPYVAKSFADFLIQLEGSDPIPPLEVRRQVRLASAGPTAPISAFERDLGLICQHCLRRDPAKRYPSAGALADELEHLLRGEPITARPPRRHELIVSWVRCHRLAATVSVSVALALLAGLAATTWQLQRAERFLAESRAANAQLTQNDIRSRLAEYDAKSTEEFRRTALHNLTLLFREHPTNEAVAARLWSALTSRAHPIRLLPPLPHAGEPYRVAWTPNGQHLLTTDAGTIHLWEISTGRLVGSVPHNDYHPILTDRAAGWLATVHPNGGLGFWSVPDLRSLAGPWTNAISISSSALAHSGQWLAAASTGQLRVWSVQPPKLVWVQSLTNAVKLLAFSSDDSTLLVADDSGSVIQVWATNGIWRSTSEWRLPGLTTVEAAPEGGGFALANSNSVLVLPALPETQPTVRDSYSKEFVRAIAYSPDGKRLTVATSGPNLREYDLSSGELTGRFPAVPQDKDSVAYRPGASMLSVSTGDGRVWFPSGDPAVRSYEAFKAGVFAYQAEFRADGRAVAVPAHPNAVQVFELSSPFDRESVELVETNATRFVVFPDGENVLLLDQQGRVGVRRLENDSAFEPWFALEHQLVNIDFSPSGRWLLVQSAGGLVTLRDVQRREHLDRRLDLRTPLTQAFAFDSTEKCLALATTNEVQIWNIESPRAGLLARFAATNAQTLKFSPDGKRLVLTELHGWSGTLVDTATWMRIPAELRHAAPIGVLKFSQDSRFLATGAQDRTPRVWNTANGQPVSPPLENGNDGHCLALRPDGQELFTGDWRLVIRRWHLPGGYPAAREFSTAAIPHTLECSPDGRWLACGHERGVQCWDTDSGTPVIEPLDLGRQVIPKFSRDGRRLLLMPIPKGPPEVIVLRLPSIAALPSPSAMLAYAQLVLDGALNSRGGLEPFTAETLRRTRAEAAPILNASAWPGVTRLRLVSPPE